MEDGGLYEYTAKQCGGRRRWRWVKDFFLIHVHKNYPMPGTFRIHNELCRRDEVCSLTLGDNKIGPQGIQIPHLLLFLQ